jgi:hypothetical protein
MPFHRSPASSTTSTVNAGHNDHSAHQPDTRVPLPRVGPTTAATGADAPSMATAREGTIRPWPLILLAAPAAVAVWSGWVGIGRMTGFGQVHPLPRIWDSLHLDSAITLPIGGTLGQRPPVAFRQVADHRGDVLVRLQPRLHPGETRPQQLQQLTAHPPAQPGAYPGGSSRLRFCRSHKRMIARWLPRPSRTRQMHNGVARK